MIRILTINQQVEEEVEDSVVVEEATGVVFVADFVEGVVVEDTVADEEVVDIIPTIDQGYECFWEKKMSEKKEKKKKKEKNKKIIQNE